MVLYLGASSQTLTKKGNLKKMRKYRDKKINFRLLEVGITGIFVFIYTTATDSSKLQQIVDFYKNDRFKSKKIFSLYFYNDREQALGAITNIGLFLPVASYSYNANNGLDELKLLINNIKYNE